MKKNKNYDLIISLGAACFTTDSLRACTLQTYSYPFDWLAGADFAQRLSIFLNKFNGWLNIEDLEYFGKSLDSRKFDVYLNKKTGIYYKHDFPQDIPLSETHKKVFEKYQRRIGRMFNLIDDAKDVLLVYIEQPDKKTAAEDEKIIEGFEKIKAQYPNKNIEILYIFCDLKESTAKEKVLDENILKISLNYKAMHSGALPHEVDPKALVKILENYGLKKTRFLLISKLKRGVKINFFRVLPSIFRFRLYIFGLRLDLSLGRIGN